MSRKIVEVALHSGIAIRNIFSDADRARDAYLVVRAAMDKYREFRNDEGATVMFATAHGEEALAVRAIYAIHIIDCTSFDDEQYTVAMENARWKKRVRDQIAAEGLLDKPEAS